MEDRSLRSIHRHRLVISDVAIDANGHTNNVEYVRWMQDAAVSHAEATGCSDATKAAGASWVVRSHHIEYLQPTFAGDRLVVFTWVSNLRKASSRRRYLLIRERDGATIARGETNWVFVDTRTGRPIAIPNEVSSLFEVVPENLEPRGEKHFEHTEDVKKFEPRALVNHVNDRSRRERSIENLAWLGGHL